MQLVEFNSDFSVNQLFTCPHDPLCCIYNTAFITGPLFLHEASSRVSYHTKSPAVNDEFKIRLPDVLTPQHWLKFTVMHLHVKPTAQRASLLGKMMSGSVEVADKTTTMVGLGFLQLMPAGEALLEDKEHAVRVYSFEDATEAVSGKPSAAGSSSLSEGMTVLPYEK